MMAPEADQVVPMFSPLLVGEPVPVNGRMKVPDTPGFGVELNPGCRAGPAGDSLDGVRAGLDLPSQLVTAPAASPR